MPEFKLKKIFGKSRSPSHSPGHRQKGSAFGDQESGSKRSEGNRSPHTSASPEHHHHGCASSGYESRSSLSGSSFSGGGSKSNSLERQSHMGSDGGISSMSGSGTDDSGHSSMSSPLNLPMEQLQSFNAMYRTGQLQNVSSPHQLNIQGPPKSLHRQVHQIPRQSSQGQYGHSISAKNISTAATSDRLCSDTKHEMTDSVFLPNSPDRHRQRKQLSLGFDSHQDANVKHSARSSRNSSLDRESFNTETSFLVSENGSVPEPYSLDQAEEINFQTPHMLGSNISPEDYRNKVIFELQWQVAELHERCAQLQKDADLARDRLGSSMHSVTTFWSPELKKERGLRKEEAARCSMLYEQLMVRQAELKRQQDLLRSKGLEIDKSGAAKGSKVVDADNALAGDTDSLQDEKRTQEKELGILHQTVEELEKHIEMQKHTLSARDASIKTLLDMVQGKRMASNGEQSERSEREILQTQAALNANRICELEATLQAKDANIKKLKELKAIGTSQSASLDGQQPSNTNHTLSAMIDTKDSQISSLEKEVAVLEDKLLRSQEDLTLGDYHDLCTQDAAGFKGKQLHYEIQKVKDDLSRRERKLTSAQRHTEMLQCQQQETLHHITVLKEQLADKDKQAVLLQTEVEGLQKQLKNKDGTIERKRKENQTLISDKQNLESELTELKDQLESKEHKITVLKRKAEMHDDALKEKDEQLYRARSRQTRTDTLESPVFSLEDAIAERERQIERLQQLQDQSDRDHQEELDLYVMTNQDLKTQMGAMRFELTAKQAELRELREEATKLRGQKLQMDAKMRQVELVAQDQTLLPQDSKERVSTETQTDIITPAPEMWSSTDESLTGVLDWSLEPTSPGPSLLEELQKKVSDMEVEKKEKEHQIEDMQDIIKEYRQKVGTLKRNQQKEKEKNAQLLDAAKKREDSFTDDASHLSTAIEQKNAKIGELEEALRESVRITAQREMDMMELQTQIEASKTAMEEMRTEVEGMRASSRDYTSKLATLSRQLDDKDAKIRRMAAQRHYHLQELYEIKQEAVQAAVSEKDASIALLEITNAKKPRQMEQIQYLRLEKQRLQATLKEVTQTLTRLREGRRWGSGSTSDCTASGTEDRGNISAGKKSLKDGSTTI